MPADVVVEVEVENPVPHARGRSTTLQLSWSRADPLAVVLLLTSTPDHPALPKGRWVVLRDFLRYGLEEPTGDGQVRIRPESGQVSFRLSGNGRTTVVAAGCATVRGFLDRTEEVVPSGEESSEAETDALIEALLRS